MCGGRDFTDRGRVQDALQELPADAVLVHGDGSGADRLAAQVWAAAGRMHEAHPADWARYGKAAGVIRNREMVDSGVDLVLAFPGGTGTADTVARATAAGVPVRHA